MTNTKENDTAIDNTDDADRNLIRPQSLVSAMKKKPEMHNNFSDQVQYLLTKNGHQINQIHP